MPVLTGLVPVFLLLALGVALRRTGVLTDEAAVGLNRLVANVALPAFFVLKVGTTPLELGFSPLVVAVVCGLTLLVAVASLALAAIAGVSRPKRGVLSQAAMRGNIAYVAFPIIQAVAGDEGLRLAAVTAAVLIPLMNFLAVAVLELARGGGGHVALLGRVAANPMVASALAGLGLSALGWAPWPWLGATLQVLSDFALPGALLALGAQLELGRWRGVWAPLFTASALKLALLPLLGWWLMGALDVAMVPRLVGVLLLAAPTAVASYPVAAELGGDRALAGACVVATTIACFATYPIWTALLASG